MLHHQPQMKHGSNTDNGAFAFKAVRQYPNDNRNENIQNASYATSLPHLKHFQVRVSE
jgi:hypothetical protein